MTLLALLAASAAWSAETPYQSLESIRSVVQRFLHDHAASTPGQEAKIAVGRLDSRLSLAACGAPLEAFMPPGGRRSGPMSVGVRCSGPKPWSLYVPATVSLFGDVLVAARSLPRGATVSEGDFRRQRLDLGRLRNGYFTAAQPLVGMVLKRPIEPGRPFQAHWLEAPSVIQRGSRVIMVARVAGLEVRMTGQALADGAVGDLIRVKNLSSKRVVQGKVTKEGIVRVLM